MAVVRSFIRGHRGQALVELALVLPILLLMLFGIVEFGRIFNAYLVVSQAAREGARVAALGGTDEEITQAVSNAAGIFDAEDLDIQIDPEGSRERGEAATISVFYNVDIIAPVISSIVPDPYQVSATMVMRVE